MSTSASISTIKRHGAALIKVREKNELNFRGASKIIFNK